MADTNEMMTTLLLANQSGGMTKEDKDIIRHFLRAQINNMKAEKEARERHERSRLDQIKRTEQREAMLRKYCPHNDPNKGTRLRGQYLPSGQLCLICSRCFSEFHNPPKKGQVAAPQHLMPPEDKIGGPQNFDHSGQLAMVE